jgi:hypothetical protein
MVVDVGIADQALVCDAGRSSRSTSSTALLFFDVAVLPSAYTIHSMYTHSFTTPHPDETYHQWHSKCSGSPALG